MSAAGRWILVNSCSVQVFVLIDSALRTILVQLYAASSICSPHHFHLCPSHTPVLLNGMLTSKHACTLQLTSHTLYGTERYWPSIPKPKPEQNNSVDNSWASPLPSRKHEHSSCSTVCTSVQPWARRDGRAELLCFHPCFSVCVVFLSLSFLFAFQSQPIFLYLESPSLSGTSGFFLLQLFLNSQWQRNNYLKHRQWQTPFQLFSSLTK